MDPTLLRCVLGGLLCAGAPAHGQPPNALVDLINAYRAAPGECEGRRMPAAPPLAAPPALSRVRVDSGTLLNVALERAGYAAQEADAVYLSGAQDAATTMAMIEQKYCKLLRSARYSAIGVVQARGSWLIVLASPAPPPPETRLPPQDEAGRALLAAVNRARAVARHCGTRLFPAAPALTWNAALGEAARAHSADMAAQRYLDHKGKDGRMADQRAAAAGYLGARIGENIAAGQGSAEEAVQGWIDSPGHCANLMRDDFSEMGAAYAVSKPRPRIYWTQVLGTPR